MVFSSVNIWVIGIYCVISLIVLVGWIAFTISQYRTGATPKSDLFVFLSLSPLISLLWPILIIIILIEKHSPWNSTYFKTRWKKMLAIWKKTFATWKRRRIQKKFKGFDPSELRIEIIDVDRNPLARDLGWDLANNNVILFVSENPQPMIESFIQRNFREIAGKFKNLHPDGLSFKFIIPGFDPVEQSRLSKKLRYKYPALSDDDLDDLMGSLTNVTLYDVSKQLKRDLVLDWPIEPGFFRAVNKSGSRFSYFQLPSGSEQEIDKAIWYYLSGLVISERYSNILYSTTGPPPPAYAGAPYPPHDPFDFADIMFDYDEHKFSREIADYIEALKLMGQEKLLVRSILNKLEGYSVQKVIEKAGNSLSRMLIDSEFRIILLDYRNLEVKMPALSKVLFLLFLRHPEGIFFKHLSDHESELYEIYRALSLRESTEGSISSIKDLVNPLSNSVNEKASRIKSAFVKHFSEDVAEHYHITGDRGGPKKITLERALIDWQVGHLNWPFHTSKSSEQSQQEEEKILGIYSAAIDKMREKDYNSARPLLTEVILLNNNHYWAYMQRAICQFELSRYEEAENDGNTAIELNPRNPIPYLVRSKARLMLCRYEEALEDVTKYLKERDNEHAESYYIRGLINLELGSEKANQDFVNAKELGHEKAAEKLEDCSGIIPTTILLEKHVSTLQHTNKPTR